MNKRHMDTLILFLFASFSHYNRTVFTACISGINIYTFGYTNYVTKTLLKKTIGKIRIYFLIVSIADKAGMGIT